jgi:hypothetical protein
MPVLGTRVNAAAFRTPWPAALFVFSKIDWQAVEPAPLQGLTGRLSQAGRSFLLVHLVDE